jgi:hypothetical protein
MARKPKELSRANEFRQALVEWRRAPQGIRPSLRDLAKQLGTSHQLLSHLLTGLDLWLAHQTYNAAAQIKTRARHENRLLTQDEIWTSENLERTAVRLHIGSLITDSLREVRKKADDGEALDYVDVEKIRMSARQRHPIAVELLARIKAGAIETISKAQYIRKEREQDRETAERLLKTAHPDWSPKQLAAGVKEMLSNL